MNNKIKKQYPKVGTEATLKRLKSSLPFDWRERLPVLSGVSIRTIEKFLSGKQIGAKSQKSILSGVIILAEHAHNNLAQIAQQFNNVGHE